MTVKEIEPVNVTISALLPICAACLLLILSACATPQPIGPTLVALPGQGKAFEVFRQDDSRCRQYAAQSTGNGTPAGAATNSDTPQRRYDVSYAQCMYSSGNSIAPRQQPVTNPPLPNSSDAANASYETIVVGQSSTHSASIQRNPANGALVFNLDHGALHRDGYDSSDGTLFVPTQIVNIFDLPNEVAVIVEGHTQRCSVRYGVIAFYATTGGGLYLGRCGQRYKFRLYGTLIVAIEDESSDPEVIWYSSLRTSDPVRLSALTPAEKSLLENNSSVVSQPPTQKPEPTPPAAAQNSRATPPAPSDNPILST